MFLIQVIRAEVKVAGMLVQHNIPLSVTDIPQSVWATATVVEESDKKYYRMDILWHYFSTLRDPDGSHHFERLSAIAMLILVIPHSDAEEERVFSMVRKIRLPFDRV